MLTSIPNGLFALQNLKFLDISNNKLGSVKELGGYLSEAIAKAQALVEFHASGNFLTHLPQSIGDLSNLEVLDLHNNKLVELPDRFGCLSKLLKLNLDENQLTEIPASIGNLERLSNLSIAKNQLKLVQNDCLCELDELVMLDLHQNQFKTFSAVPKTKKLDSLVLSFNRLVQIDNLENAVNLCVLDLHSNKLESLP